MRKKVLFISYYFPPIGGGGVQRSLKYVKYLPEFNYKPVVITTEKDIFYKDDFSFTKEIPTCSTVIRLPSYNVLKLFSFLKRLPIC
jgi:hypothetical protein